MASATFGPQVGWFGYSPLENHFINIQSDLAPWQQMLIWLGLIVAWTVASIFILHRPSPPVGKLTGGDD